jgi:hypothetical protein
MNKLYELLIDYLLHPTKFHLLNEISKVLESEKFKESGDIFKKLYESKNSNSN